MNLVRQISFLLGVLAIAQTGIAQNKAIDVQHYRFELALNDSTDVIYGKASINFIPLKKNDHVYFDLTEGDNSLGKGMKVTGVKSGHRALDYSQKQDRVYIRFEAPLDSGKVETLSITYHGIPKDGLIIGENKFGHRTFFADNWPERAHQWIPSNDHPSDKATVDFVITAPDHYQVVANGKKITEKPLEHHRTQTHWKMKRPISTKIMAIGVADFAVQRVALIDQVPIESWVFAQNKEKGFSQYAVSKNILPFYTSYIAPFPYVKLANVQSKTRFGGLENASNIFYSENSIQLDTPYTKADKIKLEALMAHETAHQWFGDEASETDWEHLWLSEGFATYLTDIYLEHRYGESFFRSRLRDERREVLDYSKKRNTPVVDTLGREHPMQLLNPNSYQKGAWVLHMLRRKLGDSLFQKGLQTYYKTYKDGNATTSDFKKIMAEISGQNLDQFFKQWLYTPGQPFLTGQWHYDKSKQAVVLSIQQTQNEPFSFPLELRLENDNTSLLKTIEIKKKTTSLTLPIDFKPTELHLDPKVNLLFKGSLKRQP